ncbi:sensor domain-containing diguanylate cyclase [Caldibacillus lycopersici]|uniref:Sensor domain-containing diguanylate cyclase n=1 Tax=Perspicuibacillus lycopersici TaxID=1325689 RepID=A0AAE3IUW7_9BACI|nr:sensor domain-containing diguanylate cyclase [Perspicuibacillus lycopersici]MCU9614028.1 sensor domain-containing diguanylate cyclase [Perspicuibacillus lycopersici]
MVLDKKIQYFIWIAWVIIFPAGLWICHELEPPTLDLINTDFYIFVLLMIPAALIPIIINKTLLSVIQWITLAVFLKFGLYAELILGQIVVLLVLSRVHLTKDQLYRFPLNSSMFVIVSIVSACVYYLLGGTHETSAISNLSFIRLAAIYLAVYFFLNQFMIFFCYRLLFKEKVSIFSAELLWESLIQIVTFPIGIILYFLYNNIGIISAVLIGFPVISMLLVLKYYNTTKQMNNHLQKAVEFGHQLTERLKSNEVLEVFIHNLLKMFPIDYLYILDNVNGEQLELIHSYENGENVDIESSPIRKFDGIAGMVWANEEAVLFGEKKEWEKLSSGYIPNDMESVLTVPMMKNNEVTGVLTIGTKRKRTYEKYHLMIIDILCSYLAIAFENARHYERTKFQSERCQLTNLYNARVFTEKLEENFDKLNNGEVDGLSLLLIDIDHFKMVNDTYGHQSGDEILIQVADLLKNIVNVKGLLARYGGEEFVILLPNVNKEDADLFAERIRETIENRTFTMYDNLSDTRRKLTARITVSIGVASSPTDTDDPMALLRYADRALYIGAKRVGRNKAAKYVS